MHHIDSILELAKGFLEKDGSVVPTFFFQHPNGQFGIAPADFRNDKTKYAFLDALRTFFAEEGVREYGFVGEIWFCAESQERPSKSPNRKEGLQVF